MAVAMRRDVPKERVFFLVVLSCSLLLFSVVLLRGEVTTSSRTFRDGFTVANRELAKTESLARDSTAASNGSANATMSTDVVLPKGALEVKNDEHLTTITTEDGDEITIKRAANSKNKITTISAHDDGKITIQNVDKPTTTAPPASMGEAPTQSNGIVSGEKLLVVNSAEKVPDVFAAPADEATTDDSEKAKNGKKVTVVHVSRQLTRVLLEDADEGDDVTQGEQLLR